MSFKSIAIFANALSGSLNKNKLEKSCEHLRKFIPVEIIYTTSLEEAKRKIKSISENKDILQVACGGDGSIATLLNNTNLDYPFGIIPQGTANVVAVELGIPTDILNACKGLLTFAVKETDVAVCNGNKFLFTAGIGFDAEAAYSVSKKLKKHFGQYAYYVSTILSFINRKPANLIVEVDDKFVCEGEWFVASNMRRYGGNLFFSPNARYDDGLLDAVVLKELNLKSLMKILCYAKGKRDFPTNEAVAIKAAKMSVKSQEPIRYQIDGEVFDPQCGFELFIQKEKAKILTP